MTAVGKIEQLTGSYRPLAGSSFGAPPSGGTSGQKAGQKAGQEIRFLGDLQRLDAKPGDKFVITVPRPVSIEAADRIRQAVARWLGGVATVNDVLILEPGMTIGAVRDEAIT